MIVETEAYKRDPASHGYTITPRSEIMLRSHGRWYIYFIYGMYHCLNITTNKGDVGAVLIRALAPLEGKNKMKKRRKTDKERNLLSGPGKLCQAMGITKSLNDTALHKEIGLFHYQKFSDKEVISTKRIGIKEGKDLDWRFYIRNSPFVSKKYC